MSFFKNLFGRTTPETFWAWFLANSEQLAAVTSGSELRSMRIGAKFRRAFPDLSITVEGVAKEFIIGANGKLDNIEKVEATAATAPEIPGWKVIAFRPRRPELVAGTDIVYFSSSQNGRSLDLIIYIDGLTPENTKELTYIGSFLLEASIGECDLLTKIGNVDFQPLVLADGTQRRLAELAEVVDAWQV